MTCRTVDAPSVSVYHAVTMPTALGLPPEPGAQEATLAVATSAALRYRQLIMRHLFLLLALVSACDDATTTTLDGTVARDATGLAEVADDSALNAPADASRLDATLADAGAADAE